jgi:hypothetical protein
VLQRVLLIAVAVLLAGNGGYMLFAPQSWFGSLESVAHTGPFNGHFVRDVGCAFLAAAVGFALAAWRRDWRVPGMVAALTFLGPHAGVHLWELGAGLPAAAHAGIIDVLGVYGPPAIALFMLAAALRDGRVRGGVS